MGTKAALSPAQTHTGGKIQNAALIGPSRGESGRGFLGEGFPLIDRERRLWKKGDIIEGELPLDPEVRRTFPGRISKTHGSLWRVRTGGIRSRHIRNGGDVPSDPILRRVPNLQTLGRKKRWHDFQNESIMNQNNLSNNKKSKTLHRRG